jgi:hypothetical protein
MIDNHKTRILKAKIKDKIVFIGNINENRIKIINEFEDKVIHINSAWDKDEWSQISNNYLFFLNIHRHNGCQSLETLRCVPILANGGVILSEDCNELDKEEYKDYNIIFCKSEELYSNYSNYIKNIDYNEIFRRALLFRSVMNVNKDLDDYINYHNSL